MASNDTRSFNQQFANAEALAEWLESLHECDASGMVSNHKWAPAQAAAKAAREAGEGA